MHASIVHNNYFDGNFSPLSSFIKSLYMYILRHHFFLCTMYKLAITDPTTICIIERTTKKNTFFHVFWLFRINVSHVIKPMKYVHKLNDSFWLFLNKYCDKNLNYILLRKFTRLICFDFTYFGLGLGCRLDLGWSMHLSDLKKRPKAIAKSQKLMC